MIAIRNLSRSFGPIRAVNEISFAVDTGEIVGFLGPNGAGKTTTMRMMVGFLQPETGEVELDGVSVFQNPLAASARIGYLAEHNPLYGEMSTREFLTYIGELRRMERSRLQERLEFVRAKCALDEVWRQQIRTLSKGYRQRLGLAQAILHDPEVLILDEPTGGLDPNQILEIRSLIRELGAAKTVLLSSHIMQEVQALCSRVIIINAGRIVVDDQIENLSSYISGFNRVRLELEQEEEADFTPFLDSHPAVQLESLVQKGSVACLEFHAPSEIDIRKELSAFVAERGWQLLSIYQERQSLEDIFHELTAGGFEPEEEETAGPEETTPVEPTDEETAPEEEE